MRTIKLILRNGQIDTYEVDRTPEIANGVLLLRPIGEPGTISSVIYPLDQIAKVTYSESEEA